MKQAKKKRSIRWGFLLVCFVLITLIFIELSLVFITSNSLFQRYQLANGRSILQVYSQSLDSRLRIVNSYIEALITNQNDVKMVGATSDARTRFTVRKSVSLLLSNLLSLEPMANGVLCWSGDEQISVNSTSSMRDHERIIQHILTLMRKQERQVVNTGWQWTQMDGRWYLVNVHRYQNRSIAVWMDESIIASGKMAQDEDESYHLFLFCQQGEAIIGTDAARTDGGYEPSHQTVTQASSEGGFVYGCTLMNVESKAFHLLITIMVSCILIVGTVFLCISVIRHLVNGMIREIHHGLLLKGEDLSCKLAHTGHTLESDDVFGMLDDMSEKILNLQKNIYMHEINEQKSRLQALHMQINSHFFGNCMNIIFSLAEVKNTPLIQDFCIYLIDYLHYVNTAFKTSSILSDELKHLHNYLTLQQMRYPGRIHWEMEVAPEVKDYCILPLVLLTFIENIFKHAIGSVSFCHILVRVSNEECNGQKGFTVHIEDDGKGIDENLAVLLNNFDFSQSPEFDHKSGIEKTLARIQLSYGEAATFHIGRNAEGKGTIIDLYFPAMKSE